jgi:hypothetical protein
MKDIWARDPRIKGSNVVDETYNTRPADQGYHSGSTCNPYFMIDLGEDVNISKIVYYNRDDLQNRINGSLLDGISATGEILYRAIMNSDAIQTFNVSIDKGTDLNQMWEKIVCMF